jgi:hypothetical protein
MRSFVRSTDDDTKLLHCTTELKSASGMVIIGVLGFMQRGRIVAIVANITNVYERSARPLLSSSKLTYCKTAVSCHAKGEVALFTS